MQADRHDPRVGVEGGLHTVAVVHVDVDVRDLRRAACEQFADAEHDVVEDAESAGIAAHRVVQAAGDVHRVLRRAVPHLQRRLRRTAGDQCGRLVHAFEHRVVGRPEPESFEGRVGAGRAHRGEVRGVVDGQQLRLVRGFGLHDLEAVEHAERAGQPNREIEPHRVQRVIAEVVGQVALVPDRTRRARHGYDASTGVPRLGSCCDRDYPLRTERLLLRPLAPSDAEAVHAYQGREDVCRYIPYEPRTLRDVQESLARHARSVLEEPGQALLLAVVRRARRRPRRRRHARVDEQGARHGRARLRHQP